MARFAPDAARLSTAADDSRKDKSQVSDGKNEPHDAKKANSRNEFLRDRDSIYYSDEFRRLEGITQVAEIEIPALHNRLTHSFRVEQIARTLALKLNAKFGAGIDVDVVKAAALAHDLGHPPFGHAGEVALQEASTCSAHNRNPDPFNDDRLTKPCPENSSCLQDSFEGNAQTLRILTTLGVGERFVEGMPPYGLDLRARTLRAVAKYPWLRNNTSKTSSKWCFYDCEIERFYWLYGTEPEHGKSSSRDEKEDVKLKSLEAQVMDWADDIAYAVHDIEDFFRAGIIPLQQLRDIESSYSFKEFARYLSRQDATIQDHTSRILKGREKFLEAMAPVNFQLELSEQFRDDPERNRKEREKLEEMREEIAKEFPFFFQLRGLFWKFPRKRFTGSGNEIREINELRKFLTQKFEDATSISKEGNLAFDDRIVDINRTLKQLVWFYVIDSPMLAAVQAGQKALLKRVVNYYNGQLAKAWTHEGFIPDSPAARALPRRLVDIASMLDNPRTEKGFGSYGTSGYIEKNRARAVIDFVSGMTERQAYAAGTRLTGSTEGRRFETGVL